MGSPNIIIVIKVFSFKNIESLERKTKRNDQGKWQVKDSNIFRNPK